MATAAHTLTAPALSPRLQLVLVRIIAAIVFLNGLFAIIRPLAERLPSGIEALISPIGYGTLARSLDLLLGVTLMYFALQLLQRKLAAWWIATVVASAIAMLQLLVLRHPADVIAPFCTAVVLIISRDYFQAKSELRSMKQGVVVLAASIGFAVLYGVAGFYIMRRHDFGMTFGLSDAFEHTIRSFVLLGDPDLVPRSRHAKWFLESLNLIGAAALIYGLYSLFRPLDYQLRTLPGERQAADDLIRRYGQTTEDFFKLWPHNKSYFFSPDKRAVIAYSVSGGTAVCVGDPVGRPGSIPAAISQFMSFCLVNGWTPIFVYTSQAHLSDYQGAGLTPLKVGEDAIVELPRFCGETARNKHFRNINNRFSKAGFTFEAHTPPHDPGLLRETAAISRGWMNQPGRKEWSFLAGSYSNAYMRQCVLYILRDSRGKAVAFANEIPPLGGSEASIDLMRYVPGSPSNTMDYLFLKLLQDLSGRGYQRFNLGLAPLSGLETGEDRAEEKLLKLIYHSNQRFISFKGLRQFKAKFDPDWEDRYVAYLGPSARLPRIALSLAKIMRVG